MMVDHTEERRKGPYWDIAQVLLIRVKLKTLTFAGSKFNTKTYHSALIHMQFSVPFFIYVYPFFSVHGQVFFANAMLWQAHEYW